MTLTKEAITRCAFDRLDLSKAPSAKAVEAAFEIIKKTRWRGCPDQREVLREGQGQAQREKPWDWRASDA